MARKASVSSMNIQIEAEPCGDMEQPQSFISLPHSIAITYSRCSKSPSPSPNLAHSLPPSSSLVPFFSCHIFCPSHTESVQQWSCDVPLALPLPRFPLAVHFPATGNNESQRWWVAMCVALYRSAVINRACQMENEMPVRPCCSAGC